MIVTCTLETPLGTMRAAAFTETELSPIKSPATLCGLWFTDQKHFPQNTTAWIEQPQHPVFIQLRIWLKEYFSKKKDLPALPLSPQGTAFQQTVWKLLLDIPYGETSTYGEIAKKMSGIVAQSRARSGEYERHPDSRKNFGFSARAAGGAVGRNPISLVIPCHRIVGANGSLTGYAGGIERKRALLELEGFYKLLT